MAHNMRNNVVSLQDWLQGMSIEDRHHDMASWIATEGNVTVEQVVARYGVSPATARRDLDTLAEQMVIIRTRGGARAAAISSDLPLRYRAASLAEEKLAIAQVAANMVQPGQVVAFTGGTTTTQIAQELGVRVTANPAFAQTSTTVVTNAINIASNLIVRPELRIVLTGGAAMRRSYELVGPLAMAALPMINVDVFFLGVNAIDLERGFFTDHESEAEISAAILDKSKKSYIVADHNKFSSTAFIKVCGLTDVSGIITDADVDPNVVKALEAKGCPVLVAHQTQ